MNNNRETAPNDLSDLPQDDAAAVELTKAVNANSRIVDDKDPNH